VRMHSGFGRKSHAELRGKRHATVGMRPWCYFDLSTSKSANLIAAFRSSVSSSSRRRCRFGCFQGAVRIQWWTAWHRCVPPPARCQLLMSRRLTVYRLDLDRNKVMAFTDARKKTPRLVLESRISSSSATLACSSDLAAPIHNDTLSSSEAIHYMCALLPRRLTALSQVLN
jgi:hypothetical protein